MYWGTFRKRVVAAVAPIVSNGWAGVVSPPFQFGTCRFCHTESMAPCSMYQQHFKQNKLIYISHWIVWLNANGKGSVLYQKLWKDNHSVSATSCCLTISWQRFKHLSSRRCPRTCHYVTKQYAGVKPQRSHGHLSRLFAAAVMMVELFSISCCGSPCDHGNHRNHRSVGLHPTAVHLKYRWATSQLWLLAVWKHL